MVALSIFGLKIYRYGIFYAISFLVGYSFLGILSHKQFFANINPKVQNILDNQRDNLIIIIMLGVIIGGRLGHFLIYYPMDIISNPLSFFEVWKGGMSFIGGIVGVTTGVAIFCKKQKIGLKDITMIFDILACIAPFGVMIGRVGNFLNQELYGRPVSDLLPGISNNLLEFGQKIFIFWKYSIDDTLRLNTNLLASFFEGFMILLIMQILFWSKYKKKLIGLLGPIRLVMYSSVRFVLEYARQDSYYEYIGPFTKSQRFFLPFVIIGIVWIIVNQKTHNMKKIYRRIASAIIISKDNKILMGKKDPAKGGVYPDCRYIPGGGLQANETLEEALARETMEETGADISKCKIEKIDFVEHGESPKTLKETGERVLCKMEFNRFKVYIDQNAKDIPISPNDDLVEMKRFDMDKIGKIKQVPGGKEFFERFFPKT